MFEHIFHVIHWIRESTGDLRDFQSIDVLTAFTQNSDIDVRKQPNTFMKDMFVPVAEAMDRIFNWRDLKVSGTREVQ